MGPLFTMPIHSSYTLVLYMRTNTSTLAFPNTNSHRRDKESFEFKNISFVWDLMSTLLLWNDDMFGIKKKKKWLIKVYLCVLRSNNYVSLSVLLLSKKKKKHGDVFVIKGYTKRDISTPLLSLILSYGETLSSCRIRSNGKKRLLFH